MASSKGAYLNIASSGEEFTRCVHCGYQNCDIRVVSCGCSFHARCIPVSHTGSLKKCPSCSSPASSLSLFAMSFREVDEARKTTAALANNSKRNRKRKGSTSMQDVLLETEYSGEKGERRSGRWTKEEMRYVDELIIVFENGELPLQDGTKLNDFLSGILKSKQSRLTKKMKNAKLSARSYHRVSGCISDPEKARHFSSLEDSFFHSVQCHQERAEIKFHMRKEWRELFSTYCVSVGQVVDANNWLSSVEEMDRRESLAKDSARFAKRKLMLGNSAGGAGSSLVLENSLNNTIDNATGNSLTTATSNFNMNTVRNPLSVTNNKTENEIKDQRFPIVNGKNPTESFMEQTNAPLHNTKSTENKLLTTSYLSRVMMYMQQNAIPFEHVDAWVPSFVPGNGKNNSSNGAASPLCRLCFAGSISSNIHIADERMNQPLTQKEQNNLKAFGEYSENFSFDVGSGLPGRVYQSGVPTWEQSVQNAPALHFERGKGACQYGIRTVVGIPVPSPNVGRIVIILYSQFDREKDQDMVVRLCDEFTRFGPCPRWKLVIELGEDNRPGTVPEVNAIENNVVTSHDYDQSDSGVVNDPKDSRIYAVVSLLGEYMPSDPSSNLASYIPGFMAMRLMMLKPSWTDLEKELVQTLVASYTSYTSAGRSKAEVAVLLARDCMFLVKQQSQQQSQTISPLQANQSTSSTAASGYLSNIKNFL